MMNNLRFRSFRNEDIEGLHAAFVRSFAKNAVGFKPSLDLFSFRVFEKLKVCNEFSSVAIHPSDGIVGFVLHAKGQYKKMLTAYNGGTGVVPEHQKKGIAQTLYAHTLLKIKSAKVNRIVLEVITTNDPAIKLYERLGFQFSRSFKCFKLRTGIKTDTPFEIEPEKNLPEEKAFWTAEPSFLDSSEQLAELNNEQFLSCAVENKTVGYLRFQPKTGRISQIAVAPEMRGKGVGRSLIAQAQKKSEGVLTIMNVDEEAEETIEALTRMGFINEVDQYEMELII